MSDNPMGSPQCHRSGAAGHTGSKTEQAIRLVEAGMSKNAAAKKSGINRKTLIRGMQRKEAREGKPQCPCCLNRVDRVMLPPQYVEQIWTARRKLYPQEFD